MSESLPGDQSRWLVAAAWLIVLVNDGWSGRPLPEVRHQAILLPVTVVFGYILYRLLRGRETRLAGLPTRLVLGTLLVFEMVSVVAFAYERRHFAKFGYGGSRGAWLVLGVTLVGLVAVAANRRGAGTIFAAVTGMSLSGLLFAIHDFPLNYLRSDMLPVILWADQRLVRHASPYATMHVGTRLYDFPYLPGMLVAYLPAVASRLDVRWVNAVCLAGVASLIFFTARAAQRRAAALLLGLFLLSPFLQYRHELYLAPHWLALAAAFALIARRQYVGGAAVFGLSMALYQLSWVLFPFLVLFAYRRDALRAALLEGGTALAAMMAVLAPFLRLALQRIAHNTVGQWSLLPHAQADPMNLSYWATYLVRPDQLKWVQLIVLTAIFGFCVIGGRCRTFADTLRWMCVALAVFIALNVLVDGYFYLTLFLMLLLYTLAQTDIWPDLRVVDQNAPEVPATAGV